MMGALGGELRVPISAIESYAYCPRQCALVHVERSYKDNVFTLRGRHVHERVHAGQDTADHGIETLRALLLYSDRLGLIGQADLVEMRPAGPYPVEFKPGHTHRTPAELQLCAQALCLEEMYGLPVPAGAIYEAGAHARREVVLGDELRGLCRRTIVQVRRLLARAELPPPTDQPQRCRSCSLLDICLPEVVRDRALIESLQRRLYTPLEEPDTVEW